MVISKSFCCALIALGTFSAAQAAYFRFYNGSADNYIETPIDEPLRIYPYIDKTKNVTIYAAGFKHHANNTIIVTVISIHISLGTTNVILLNWEKEAQGILPGVLGYGPAVIAARQIASVAGKSLVTLFRNGIRANTIHLIGHSLGAHLMGWTAEKVQTYNYNVSSICGFDPAGPGFGEPIGLSGLKPSQAPLVYVIHTNPGQYGTSESCGTVDFWANCDYDGLQPGCPMPETYLLFNNESSCSHNRPWILQEEVLQNPRAFPAASANSCSDWISQNSSNTEINYYGDDVDPSKQGNFYFSTNAASPYSKGLNGLRPN